MSVFNTFSHVPVNQRCDGSYPLQQLKSRRLVQSADEARRGEGIFDHVSSLIVGDPRLREWCSFESLDVTKGSGATFKKSSESTALILELVAVARLNPFASSTSQTTCFVLVTTALYVHYDDFVRHPPKCNENPFFVNTVLPKALWVVSHPHYPNSVTYSSPVEDTPGDRSSTSESDSVSTSSNESEADITPQDLGKIAEATELYCSSPEY